MLTASCRLRREHHCCQAREYRRPSQWYRRSDIAQVPRRVNTFFSPGLDSRTKNSKRQGPEPSRRSPLALARAPPQQRLLAHPLLHRRRDPNLATRETGYHRPRPQLRRLFPPPLHPSEPRRTLRRGSRAPGGAFGAEALGHYF